MSAELHHASKCIADFRLPIANYSLNKGLFRNTSIGNRQLAIDNVEWYRTTPVYSASTFSKLATEVGFEPT